MNKNGFFATVDGRRRNLDRLDQARVTEARIRMERTDAEAGSNLITSRAREEQARVLDSVYANAIRVRSELERVINECRPETAPEPKNADTVQIGTVVRVECHDCETGREHAEIFQIGGHGEDCDEAQPPIRSYTTPLCLKLLKKEQGDEVTYRGFDRKEHTAHILNIWLPEDYRRQTQAA